MAISGVDILLYVSAVFFPPFAVVVKRGCGIQLLLNILLDFLGWLPGIIHAWYIIVSTPNEHRRRYKDDYHHRPSSRHSHRSHLSYHSHPRNRYSGPPPREGYYA